MSNESGQGIDLSADNSETPPPSGPENINADLNVWRQLAKQRLILRATMATTAVLVIGVLVGLFVFFTCSILTILKTEQLNATHIQVKPQAAPAVITTGLTISGQHSSGAKQDKAANLKLESLKASTGLKESKDTVADLKAAPTNDQRSPLDWHLLFLGSLMVVPATVILLVFGRAVFTSPNEERNDDSGLASNLPAVGFIEEAIASLLNALSALIEKWSNKKN